MLFAASALALRIASAGLIQPAVRPLTDLERQAAETLPHPRQVAWQQLEFTCFVHFGVNTFTGREWGTGQEDPAIFNPTALDCDQWVTEAKNAGMKLIMLTAKHHDGFCLFQSDYTDHDVGSSPWREGRGDVMAELASACLRHDMKLGFYLSPADLHAIHINVYGNLSQPMKGTIPSPVPGVEHEGPQFEYVVDDYNRYFLNQLYELLTRYGPINEVWFDGANPKPGTGQTYDYGAWYDLIRRIQPEAVIAIKGPDVRWCGNEAGHTRAEEWSVIPIAGTPDHCTWPDMTSDDLGSMARIEATLAEGGWLHWYPAETDTSIRHGWFWRDEEQHVRPPDEMFDVWERSVGGNTVLLLNVPPDRRGLFADRDVDVLREIGRRAQRTYAHNLAQGAGLIVSATSVAESPASLLDADPSTAWRAPDGVRSASIVLNLHESRRFDRVVLQEDIARFGQRIERFAIDVWLGNRWCEVTQGTTVGLKRIVRLPLTEADRVRVRITSSRVSATLSEIGLYRSVE